MKKIIIHIVLQLLILMYSFSYLLCKEASEEDFLSLKYCVLFGFVFLIMVIYAVGWQQVIKRIPLSVAIANKSVIIIWGMIFGYFFGGEVIGRLQYIGAVFVIIGVVIIAFVDN